MPQHRHRPHHATASCLLVLTDIGGQSPGRGVALVQLLDLREEGVLLLVVYAGSGPRREEVLLPGLHQQARQLLLWYHNTQGGPGSKGEGEEGGKDS